MAWDVEFTNEFAGWWNSLSEGEQTDIDAVVELLEEFGPKLRRPHVGTISESRHNNMKELIVQHAGDPYRVFFAFDPLRHAILLIGGNKGGDGQFYQKMIPVADKLYDQHLAEIAKEGPIQ